MSEIDINPIYNELKRGGFMREKYCVILKFILGWLVVILFCFSICRDIFEIIKISVLSFLGFFVVFSPTILGLYFLFKKVQDKNYRILLTSFLIPFTNFIYFIIDKIYFKTDIPMLVGFCSLFFAIPTLFVLALSMPKSLFSPLMKWYVIKTSVLMVVFGFCLMIVSLCIMPKVEAYVENNKLVKYDVIIKNIEDYKNLNGVYPQTLEDSVKSFQFFSYQPQNLNQDYILTVGDDYTRQYNYCSNEYMEGCFPKKMYNVSFEKCGDWIKVVEKN